MKRVFIFLIMFIAPLVMKAQQKTGDNWFVTLLKNQNEYTYQTNGTLMGMNMYDDTKDFNIVFWYIDFYGEAQHIDALISYTNIELFKSQIKQIRSKYLEWKNVAETNNVQDYTKEIPIKITAIKEMSGSKLSYPDKKGIRPLFVVKDGIPDCFLELSISGFGVSMNHRVHTNSIQLNELCDAIDKTMQIHTEKIREKKKTDDLFH